MIPFSKMHGNGNDFIVICNTDEAMSKEELSALALRACQRKTSVGADGILVVESSARAHFRMRLFNADGSEGEMCGNGARCIARLAHEIGAAPAGMRIETPAGVVRAEVLPPLVRLHLPPPKDWRMNLSIAWQGSNLTVHSVNTGVPHAICVVDDLAGVDVAPLGALIRRHALFAPAGTNADFIQLAGPDALAIRTYERGVEAETLACGTGIAAAALIAERLGLVRGPVQVQTAGGDTLEVALSPLTLTGPAEHSFRGTVDYR